MKIETSNTLRFDIFIAGDLDQAKQICREHCFAVGLMERLCQHSYSIVGPHLTEWHSRRIAN